MDVMRYDDHSTNWTRAVQCYHLLTNDLHVTTYGAMCALMEWGQAKGQPLRHPLGAIWAWCEERGLPKLNQLVVNKETGLPGDGAHATDWAKEVQAIQAHKWHLHFPPTAEELEAAYRRKFPHKTAA